MIWDRGSQTLTIALHHRPSLLSFFLHFDVEVPCRVCTRCFPLSLSIIDFSVPPIFIADEESPVVAAAAAIVGVGIGIGSCFFSFFSPNMAFSACFCPSQILFRINCSTLVTRPPLNQRSAFALKRMNTEHYGQRDVVIGSKLIGDWSFVGGSRIIIRPNPRRTHLNRKSFQACASWVVSSQIASSVFTLGTVAVLPFYTLMVLAPKAELTKKSMESSIPYVVLGLLYAYLLYLSWTPDTIRLMFASKYWLPELSGIAKMFSNQMTLASAWIHLLAVDLFAARQVFHDGVENNVETRHSVSLCLLFCPIGIITHVITTALTKSSGNTNASVY